MHHHGRGCPTRRGFRRVGTTDLDGFRGDSIAFLGVEVVANVGPLAQGGLNEAFGLAVGAWRVRTGETVLDAELEAGGVEVAGAIAGAVVGEQAADGDAVLGVEGDCGAQEGR